MGWVSKRTYSRHTETWGYAVRWALARGSRALARMRLEDAPACIEPPVGCRACHSPGLQSLSPKYSWTKPPEYRLQHCLPSNRHHHASHTIRQTARDSPYLSPEPEVALRGVHDVPTS